MYFRASAGINTYSHEYDTMIFWTRLFVYFYVLCPKSFSIAFVILLYTTEIKKHLHCLIFREAGSDENLNLNHYIYISFLSYIPFLSDDWRKLHFYVLFQTRAWVCNASFFFSKFWFLGQISLSFISPKLEFYIKACQKTQISGFYFRFMHTSFIRIDVSTICKRFTT